MNWFEAFLLWGGFFAVAGGTIAGLVHGNATLLKAYYLAALALVVLYIMGRVVTLRQQRIEVARKEWDLAPVGE